MRLFIPPSLHWSCPAVLGMFLLAAPCGAQTLLTDWWHTSGGTVSNIVPSPDGSVVYMGGSFNYIGPVITYGASLDLDEGQPTPGVAMPDNTVWSSISDGAGGWYIGGLFTEVGGQPRPHVAHINADGSLNDWQAAVGDGEVYSLLLDGGTLYLGGNFTTVGGQPRSGVAAVDAGTGALLPFTAALGAAFFPTAYALIVSGTNLIIGGYFATVNGTQRNYLAAVDKVTGQLASWNPAPTSSVLCIASSTDGSTIYVGGSFTTIATEYRARTAAFNATTLAILPWTVAASETVRAICVQDDVVVLGGGFSTLGGQPRENLGAADATTGALLNWIADTDSDVRSLVMHDGVVYASGEFKEINSTVRRYIGAIDLATAQVTGWDPVAGNDVYTMSLSGDKMFAGGWYTSIGGKVRNKLVAMDPTTGRPTDWDAHDNIDYGSISRLVLNTAGTVLYAGGSFSDTIGGQFRKNLVALDVSTATALPWAPLTDGQVADLVLSPDGSVLYVGGYFTSVNGVARKRLAAFNADPQQTQLLPWDPNCTGGFVMDLELSHDGTVLYVAGSFNSGQGNIGGQPRDRLAALSTTSNTNNATSWNAPVTGSQVSTILLDPSGETLYIGGLFNTADGHTVAGQPRDRLAAVSTTTGMATAWNPGANDYVWNLKWAGSGALMVCGKFAGPGAIGGVERDGFAYMDPVTGAVEPWSADFNYGTWTVTATEMNGLFLLGGNFGVVNGQTRLSLAAFEGEPASVQELGDAVATFRSFPNPTQDEVRLPTNLDARSITVLDAVGRPVLRTAYQPTLRMGGLGSGAYFLVVDDAHGRVIARSQVLLVH